MQRRIQRKGSKEMDVRKEHWMDEWKERLLDDGKKTFVGQQKEGCGCTILLP